MSKFYIKLADRVVAISCNYKQTREYCKEYLLEDTFSGNVDVNVNVTLEDLAVERRQADKEYGDQASRFTNAYLETLAVYRQIAAQMPMFDTVLFHGSVIAVDGEAYLFTAPSGTGKSTHTRLWREYFGERAFMVNDDKPLLRVCEDGRVIAYGTPWNGKHRLGTNIGVPLKGICVLAQAPENRIVKITKEEAFQTIFQQTYRPLEKPIMIKKTLELLDEVMKLPLWHMGCTISEEAVKIAYHAMSLGHQGEDER